MSIDFDHFAIFREEHLVILNIWDMFTYSLQLFYPKKYILVYTNTVPGENRLKLCIFLM